MMTIPLFTRAPDLDALWPSGDRSMDESRNHRPGKTHSAARVNRRRPEIEQPLVEPVRGIHAVMIAHDLVAGERADRRAHHDVARPVAIVVHARESDHRRAAEHDWPDVPFRAAP